MALFIITSASLLLVSAEELGQSLFQNLLEDPSLQITNYQINSAVHRAKLRSWQALAVLSAFIPHCQTHQAIAQIWPLLQVSICHASTCQGLLCAGQSNLLSCIMAAVAQFPNPAGFATTLKPL